MCGYLCLWSKWLWPRFAGTLHNVVRWSDSRFRCECLYSIMMCSPKCLCTGSATGELEQWRAKTIRNRGRDKENIINSRPIPMLFLDPCQDSCPCVAILTVFWWGCLSLCCFHQCVHCTNRRGSQRVKVLAEISICKSAETNWIVSFHLFCLWCLKSQKEIQVWQKHLIHHCLIFC